MRRFAVTFLLGVLCVPTSAAEPSGSTRYLEVVKAYADALLEHGTDAESGMILSILDRRTLKPFESLPEPPSGVRNGDRVTPHGSNVNVDQNVYRVLDALSEVTGDDRYARAADSALSAFLEVTPSPATGLFAWGEHLCWDVKEESWGSTLESAIHEPKRPTVLFDTFHELNRAATIAYCEGLWEHQIADHETGNFSRHARYDEHGPRRDFDFPKEAGYFVRDWTRAHEKTGSERFLHYVDVLASRYLRKMAADEKGLIAFDSRRGFANTSASLSLAIECHASAALLEPGPVREKLSALASGIDASLLSLPHDVGGRGFQEFTSLEDHTPYPHKDNGGYTFRWSMKYGRKTTAMLGVLCYRRSRQLGDGERGRQFRALALQAADAYLDDEPNLDERPWPVEPGIVVALQLAAHELDPNPKYLKCARRMADWGIATYWTGGNPLPKADPKCDHYENVTRADTLAYSLLQLHVVHNGLRVRMPISDIDR